MEVLPCMQRERDFILWPMGKSLGKGMTWSRLHFRKITLKTELGDLENQIMGSYQRDSQWCFMINRYHREEERLSSRASLDKFCYIICLVSGQSYQATCYGIHQWSSPDKRFQILVSILRSVIYRDQAIHQIGSFSFTYSQVFNSPRHSLLNTGRIQRQNAATHQGILFRGSVSISRPLGPNSLAPGLTEAA